MGMLAFEHEGHEGFFERIERILRFTKPFHLREHVGKMAGYFFNARIARVYFKRMRIFSGRKGTSTGSA